MNQNKIKALEDKLESIKKELDELKAKPTKLVKSWEDAFDGKGYWINLTSNIQKSENGAKHQSNRGIFKTEVQAKSALAFAQLSHIVADANGDWQADWFKEDRIKHTIAVIQGTRLTTVKVCLSITLLPMKSEEIAKACLEKHRTLWEDFWMISK